MKITPQVIVESNEQTLDYYTCRPADIAVMVWCGNLIMTDETENLVKFKKLMDEYEFLDDNESYETMSSFNDKFHEIFINNDSG